MQGISLLRRPRRWPAGTAIYGECFTHNAVDLNDPAANLRWRWMVDRNYKLIVPDPTNEPEATVELYQIKADPTRKRTWPPPSPSASKQLPAS